MAKFEDIQNLDLGKIKQPQLKDAISELLSDYEAEDNKKLFVKTAQVSIDKLYSLVEVNSPEAIQKSDDDGNDEPLAKNKQHDSKEKEISARKEKSKKAMADLDEISKEIEGCREVMREYNRKKREAKGPAVKKTRLTKLKNQFLGIIPLIPEKLKENKAVLTKTEKILLKALNDIKKTWGMNKVRKVEVAIQEKFDQLDEKKQRA